MRGETQIKDGGGDGEGLNDSSTRVKGPNIIYRRVRSLTELCTYSSPGFLSRIATRLPSRTTVGSTLPASSFFRRYVPTTKCAGLEGENAMQLGGKSSMRVLSSSVGIVDGVDAIMSINEPSGAINLK